MTQAPPDRSALALGDVLGRLGGRAGELLDLAGHDGEALARLTGPGRLDGR